MTTMLIHQSFLDEIKRVQHSDDKTLGLIPWLAMSIEDPKHWKSADVKNTRNGFSILMPLQIDIEKRGNESVFLCKTASITFDHNRESPYNYVLIIDINMDIVLFYCEYRILPVLGDTFTFETENSLQ